MTKEERREYMRAWRANHPGYMTQKSKEFRKRNPGYYGDKCNSYRKLFDLDPGWVIHHFNHDHTDDRPENLLPMLDADHRRYHNYMRVGAEHDAKTVINQYVMT